MQRLTLEEVERRRQKAVSFMHDVVGDSPAAERFEKMTPEEYANYRGDIEIIENPTLRRMSNAMTKSQLQERVRELEDELEDAHEQLDAIHDIVNPEDEDDPADDPGGEEDDDRD